MTWQTIIVAQVFASAVMTVFTRKLSLTDRKLFFVIGSLSYGMVAFMGLVFSFVFGPAQIVFPGSAAWPFLIAEGTLIPISWLLQYKIIQKLGASNAVLVSVLNYVGTAALGFVFFDEYFSLNFLAGLLLILASIVIAFRVQPDTLHRQRTPMAIKILLIVSMVVAYAFGMLAEKQAIDVIGVWEYAHFGWSLQFIGALFLLAIYGRSELPHVSLGKARNGLILGFLTSIAGVLYIYALSIGTLSHTIIAASGKIALVMVFAALFLKERNAIRLRFVAFVLSAAGLVFLTR